MNRNLLISVAMLSLTACSGGSENAAEYDIAEIKVSEGDANPAPSESLKIRAEQPPADNGSGEIPVSIPQIAYSYQYGYRLPASEIPKVQQTHVALCEKRGPKICRVLNMENSGGEGDYATGMLHIEVAAKQARAFGTQLAGAVDEHGGSQIAASINGEDLSKQIVDTEARLRSRVLLSQRLTELLRTRKGTVAELVAAERAVTDVNEEIDQARSWLKEMRGRIAFSKIIVNYQSDSPGSGGFLQPIRKSFGGIASSLGSSLGAAITIVTVTLPWVLILALVIYLRRKFKAKNRTFWGKETEASVDPE